MSTKSTIILTRENEHIYIEHLEYIKDGKGKEHNPIYIEIDKANIDLVQNTGHGLLIRVKNPDCDLFKILMHTYENGHFDDILI